MTTAVLAKAGIPLVSPLDPAKCGVDRNRGCWIVDPDGNRVEIMEMDRDCVQYDALTSFRAAGKPVSVGAPIWALPRIGRPPPLRCPGSRMASGVCLLAISRGRPLADLCSAAGLRLSPAAPKSYHRFAGVDIKGQPDRSSLLAAHFLVWRPHANLS